MGYDSKVALKYDVIRTNNMAYGLNADGSNPVGPFMETSELVLMGGMAGFTGFTQRKQLFNKPTWNGQTVSHWQYGKKAFKANFSSLSNFNNMEFIDTRLQKMEGIISSKTPTLPKGFQGSDQVKNLFEQLSKAKNPGEYSQIVRQNKATYKKLSNILRRTAPDELKKLHNIARYREIYGSTLQEFKTAQTTMRSGRSLGKGCLDILHRNYSNACLAENNFVKASGAKAGVGVMGRAGSRVSSYTNKLMATSKTMRGISRVAGKAGGAACIVMSTVNVGAEVYGAVSAAPEGQKWRDGSRQLAKSGARAGLEIGGAWAGMKAGAAIGAFAGPVGAVVGGLIGSFVGWAAGSFLANKSDFINTSVVEERQVEERNQLNQQVMDAIDKDDVQTLNGYCERFFVPMQDEKGQPILDENGNQMLGFAQVSEDEKQQKEFEALATKVKEYVDSRTAKYAQAQQEQQEQQYYAQQPQAGGAYQYNGTPQYAAGQTYAAQPERQLVKGFGINGTGTWEADTNYASAGYSWQNPAWQASLGQRFDSNNFYAFDQNNYTPLWMFNNQYGQYKMAS